MKKDEGRRPAVDAENELDAEAEAKLEKKAKNATMFAQLRCLVALYVG